MKLSKDTIEHEIVPFLRGAIEREFCTKALLHQKGTFPLTLLLEAIKQSWPLDMLKWIYEQCPAIHNQHLHMACRMGNLDCVKWITQHVKLDIVCAREAVHAPTLDVFWWLSDQGVQMLCELQDLAKHGSIEAMQKARDDGSVLHDKVIVGAIQHGHQTLMEWLYQIRCPITSQTLEAVLEYADITTLQWLRTHGCPYSKQVMSVAVETKRFDIVEWLLDIGCQAFASIMLVAVKSGCLPILQRLHGQFPEFNVCDAKLYETSYNKGCLPILQYLYRQRKGQQQIHWMTYSQQNWPKEEGCMLEFVTWFDQNCHLIGFIGDTVQYALSNQDSILLDWLTKNNHKQRVRFETKVKYLPRFKDLKQESLDFLLPVDTDIQSSFNYASCKGQLKLVQWMLQHGAKWNHETMSKAVTSGNFELVSWLETEGCPWDPKTITSGFESILVWNFVQPELVQWLKDRNCYWFRTTQLLIIQKQWRMADMLGFSYHNALFNHKWCREQCEAFMKHGGRPTTQLLIRAVELGDLSLIEKAVQFGCSLDSREILLKAVQVGLLRNIEWLFARGCPWSVELHTAAYEKGNKEVIAWVRRQESQISREPSISSTWPQEKV